MISGNDSLHTTLHLLENEIPSKRYSMLQKKSNHQNSALERLISTNGIHAILPILDLLPKADGSSLIEEHLNNLFHKLITYTCDANHYSETERVEIITLLFDLLTRYISTVSLTQFLCLKTVSGRSYFDVYLDAAYRSGNKAVIALVKNLGQQHHFTTTFSIPPKKLGQFTRYHAEFWETSYDERPFITSNHLRKEWITPIGKEQSIKRGLELLKKYLVEKNISGIDDEYDNPLMLYNVITEGKKIFSEDELKSLLLLTSDNGLLALGTRLITIEDAILYQSQLNLNALLNDSRLPLLRLLNRSQLLDVHLSDFEVRDYFLIALEENLIPISYFTHTYRSQHNFPSFVSSLSSMCTYHAIIALREKWINAEEACALFEKFGSRIAWDILFTPNGLEALREGLYTPRDMIAMKNSAHFAAALTTNALEKRRQQIANERPIALRHLYQCVYAMKFYGRSLRAHDVDKGKVAEDLADQLLNSLGQFFGRGTYINSHTLIDIQHFINQFNVLLHSQDHVMSIHRHYKRVIIANIAFALTIVGAGMLLGKYIYSKVSHRPFCLFFDKTKRQRLIGAIQNKAIKCKMAISK